VSEAVNDGREESSRTVELLEAEATTTRNRIRASATNQQGHKLQLDGLRAYGDYKQREYERKWNFSAQITGCN
jgi:hypothetical protein